MTVKMESFSELWPFNNLLTALCISLFNLDVLKLKKVGTGFSFTNNDAGYATNETQVANDLYRFKVSTY